MAILLDNKLGFGMVCAGAVAIGVTAALWLHGAAAPAAAPAAATASASGWDGAIGPGRLATPAPGAPGMAAPGEPSLTDAGGRLVIGPPLRQLFDSYLLKAGANGRDARAAELRAYLRQRLAQPALGQAEGLASDYLRYLDAERELRAQMRIAPPGEGALDAAQVGRLEDWQRQRARLREKVLGTAVVQAWFEAEDAACSTALADWRMMRAPAGSADVDSNELQARRRHGEVLEQRREEDARTCAGQLAGGPAPSA
jgi:lipase chaperone LimK